MTDEMALAYTVLRGPSRHGVAVRLHDQRRCSAVPSSRHAPFQIGAWQGRDAAVRAMGLTASAGVRLEGTNVDLGRDIIRNSGLNVIAADDLSDAAEKVVKAVRG